ncbi:hypothetical protein K7432_011327 [Basidiobolus ranarum]|uniref:Secreted protein n=1 Tax=Basidiobolus ranarum TaxID=34480 RepID=A0ABR2WMG5_9FUNG
MLLRQWVNGYICLVSSVYATTGSPMPAEASTDLHKSIEATFNSHKSTEASTASLKSTKFTNESHKLILYESLLVS